MNNFDTEYKPTGKQRHRVLQRLLRKPLLILQVEIEAATGHGVHTHKTFYWVDATPESQLTYKTTK